MKRGKKDEKNIKLTRETVRNLSRNELDGVHGGLGSSAKCLLSDYAALFGVSTTGLICPN
jgi:hypothetical protein